MREREREREHRDATRAAISDAAISNKGPTPAIARETLRIEKGGAIYLLPGI
jgi:hypothetical protein